MQLYANLHHRSQDQKTGALVKITRRSKDISFFIDTGNKKNFAPLISNRGKKTISVLV